MSTETVETNRYCQVTIGPRADELYENLSEQAKTRPAWIDSMGRTAGPSTVTFLSNWSRPRVLCDDERRRGVYSLFIQVARIHASNPLRLNAR